jgi:hypothetical protein
LSSKQHKKYDFFILDPWTWAGKGEYILKWPL